MPQYFFNMTTDQEDQDVQGVFLHGEAEAADEALNIAGEVLKAGNGPFWNSPGWRLVVTDMAGEVVCEVTMEGRRRSDQDPTSPQSLSSAEML